MRQAFKIVCGVALLLLLAPFFLLSAGDAAGQAGRRPSASGPGDRDLVLSVFAAREDGSDDPITAKDVSLYDGGVEQNIKSFAPDAGPARIVLLVDNSLTLRADVEKLQQAAREFAYEIYEGDQLMIVGYDDAAEIVTDWTDDAKKVETALTSFRKKGEPRLFDALQATLDEALTPFSGANRKRVVVVIGDGLDRGSKTSFDSILAELQKQNVTLYAVQITDRTGGAYRRDKPKPAQVIEKLTEATGGRAFGLKESREAAKAVCDELRKNRYLLAYSPTSYALTEARRLLVLANDGIQVRTKTAIR